MPWTAPVLDQGAEVDTLSGGAGNDAIFAGYGDNVDGGEGIDFLYISFKGATSGVVADFRLLSTQGSITVGGGTIQGIEGVDWLEGSEYGDYLATIDTYYSSFEPIFGLGGDDTIIASYYTGVIHGGTGNDFIDKSAAGYSHPVFGEEGNDTIIGGDGSEAFSGGDGDDVLHGGSGFDDLLGGAGDDVLNGGSVDDGLRGDAGNDIRLRMVRRRRCKRRRDRGSRHLASVGSRADRRRLRLLATARPGGGRFSERRSGFTVPRARKAAMSVAYEGCAGRWGVPRKFPKSNRSRVRGDADFVRLKH